MSKRMRKDASEQANKRALKEDNSVKITDLNVDCLHSIYKFLHVNDIFKMCAMGEVFVEPARMIFRRISAGGTVVRTISMHLNYPDQLVIPFEGLKYIGELLSKLSADFRYNVCEAKDYVSTHCTQLTELKLLCCPKERLEIIEKPFEKLQVLSLSDCALGPTFCEFNKWFPKLRHLALENCYIALLESLKCTRNMAQTMRSLESLCLDLKLLPRSTYALKCNADQVLKGNRHVKSLCLNYGGNDREFQVVAYEMVKLETLELRITPIDFTHRVSQLRSFTTVKKLILNIGTSDYCSMVHKSCPLAFDVLEELEMCYYEVVDQWFFFASSNKLKKLKLISMRKHPDGQQLLRISTTWPSLVEVAMYMDERFDFLKRFTASSVIDTQFDKFEDVKRRLLNEFTVIPSDTAEYRFAIIRKL